MNKFIVAALFAAMSFASCSQGEGNSTQDGKPAQISINLKSAGVTTFSVDDQPIDEDAAINDLIVFLVRSDGVMDVSPVYFTGAELIGGTTVPQITATTQATKVYVICNTGPFDNGPFENVGTLTDIERVSMALDGNINTASNCVSGNVWMAGNNTLEPAGVIGGIANRQASITLQYMPAKVYVIIQNNMINYTAAGNTLLDGVAIINGGAWTRFVDNAGNYKPVRTDITLPNDVPFFYNGITIEPTNWADQPTQVGGLADHAIRSFYNYAPAASFPILTSPITVSQSATEGFYLFPSITTNKAYVTVYGRFAEGGAAASPAPEDLYWSLCFGGQDGLAADIASGQKYVVTITLNGNAATGGGGGTDPTEVLVDALVDISVVPAAWSPKLIQKIIN